MARTKYTQKKGGKKVMGTPRGPAMATPAFQTRIAALPNSTAGGVFLPASLPKKNTLMRIHVNRMMALIGVKTLGKAREELLERNGGDQRKVGCCMADCDNTIKDKDSAGVICYG